MNISVNGLVRSGFGSGIVSYDPTKPADVQSLANDSTFLKVANARLAQYRSVPLHNGTSANPENDAFASSAAATLANTDLSTLSVEERAEIIESLTPGHRSVSGHGPLRAMTVSTPGQDFKSLVARLSNNQGYTGPGAAAVVATVPAAQGTTVITKGQLYDDEGFGALADQVFLAAGGKPLPGLQRPPNLLGTPGFFDHASGLPSQLLNGLGGADMSKWSERERIDFLTKVAELGRDGSLSNDDTARLHDMIGTNNRTGESAPAAVTDAKGNTVMSKDDIMEDSTLRNYLTGKVDKKSTLYATLSKADYSNLSYDERVGLVQMLSTATADFNLSDSEKAAVEKLLASSLATSESASTTAGSTTLSNGASISPDEIGSPDHFGSAVQRTLRASGLLVRPTSPFANGSATTAPNAGVNTLPYYSTDYGIQRLIGIDTSKLTSEQRLEVLERIATAGADGNVTPQESRDIVKYVDQLSGRPNATF
jgi:uncharacterized tellurite resistance protein B-like protein